MILKRSAERSDNLAATYASVFPTGISANAGETEAVTADKTFRQAVSRVGEAQLVKGRDLVNEPVCKQRPQMDCHVRDVVFVSSVVVVGGVREQSKPLG